MLVLALYFVAGRDMKWDVGRQLSWIAAASQAMAMLVVLFAFIVVGIALAAVVVPGDPRARLSLLRPTSTSGSWA